MQGRPPKHPALRTGHRRHLEMALVEAGRDRQASVVPRMPAAERGLIEAKVRGLWKTLWESDTAASWDRAADLVPIARYLAAIDEWQRYARLVRQAPMIRGSKDQLRPNPLISQLRALERELRTFEEQFGMSPRSRISLGVSLATGLSMLDRLNANLGDTEPEWVGPDADDEKFGAMEML